MALISRNDWGARPFRQPNGAITYSKPRKGVKIHHLGESGTWSPSNHTDCHAKVRTIQAYHMDVNGWSDIGYSFLVCPHGDYFEGRGLRRRNSANGNTTLNDENYAICALISHSSRQMPNDAMLNGIVDAIEHCRNEGPCGSFIGGHRDGYATMCPGDNLYEWVKLGAQRPKPQGGSAPVPANTKPVAGKVYTVRKNDSLSKIAAQIKGVTWQQIYAVNKKTIGSNPNRIAVGMKLSIPSPTKAKKPYTPPPFPTGLGPNKSRPSARGWQRCLKALGLWPAGVAYADNYGPVTQNATAQFHNKYPQFKSVGVAHDVRVGPKGWAFAHNKAYGDK